MVEETVLDKGPTTRGAAPAGDQLDVSYDIAPDKTAYLAIRHASGALTFHLPVHQTPTRSAGRTAVRFQVLARQRATRGLVGSAIKAILVEVRRVTVDKATSYLLPKLAGSLERALWERAGRKEGWLKVDKDSLGVGTLAAGVPVSPNRTLLFLHGTFSHTAACYGSLAGTPFFDRVRELYDDRIFAFNHFSISRTPEENARMLLQSLPDQVTTFDVITHSRGGLVLRNLVERRKALGPLANRFQLNRAVLVAAPNAGTPLATPQRWQDTVGWFANLLEIFPDNPFTTGAEFVANGLVWIANHAAGDLPGLAAMDGEGDMIAELQRAPGPQADAYAALVSNFHPTGNLLLRLADAGLDAFFGSANDLVVPTEGGWRIDGSATSFIPASRIGCFGPGGNLTGSPVTHVDFFDRPATAEFLVSALTVGHHAVPAVDPRKALPDRRLLRGSALDGPTAATAVLRSDRDAQPLDATTAEPEALAISVINGNLTFEPGALLIGHYASTSLGGAEAVIDSLIGGAMKHALELGLYPRDPGSHHIFRNTRVDLEQGRVIPRPGAVIVAGLGQEGSLSAARLTTTVRQAVIAWAQRLSEQKRPVKRFGLCSTLMGSGGAGVTAGEAARLIAQGVSEANELLATELDKKTWPRVERLKLIELYLDRAADAWRALRMQQDANPNRYAVDDVVKTGLGGIQRPPDTGYRGAAYDFVNVESKSGKDGEEISYTLDTKRARSEVRAKRAQSGLLRDLIKESSDDPRAQADIGRSLFNLLVPVELEAYLAGTGELQLQLDPTVADIPWELLDTTRDGEGDPRPWAVRTKLLRKLKIAGVRDVVHDANADESALIIGEPQCPAPYSRLYGAHEEALAVQSCLTAETALGADRVHSLISADETTAGYAARDIISALYERPWRILHVAGHGALPDPKTGSKGGVVLSNNTFLGPDEVESMRVVPELVFINCCHLGRGDDKALLNPRYDRSQFASGVAGALIKIGVRAVIAAGWAVDDAAATAFASAFYGTLLKGGRLIEAVGRGREAAYDAAPHSNTWAAYQCYGDPDWKFRRHVSDANQDTPTTSGEFESLGSETALKLTLSRMVVETRHQGANPAVQIARLRELEALFERKWTARGTATVYGAVAELFGEAFTEADDVPKGVEWYTRAVAAEDGTASLKAAEQLSNGRARLAWDLVDVASRHRDEMRARARQTGLTAGAKRAAVRALAESERKCRSAQRRAQGLLAQTASLLGKLRAIDDTMERARLVGSLHKRRALIAEVSDLPGRARVADAALKAMAVEYAVAERIGRERGATDLYYAAFNQVVAEVALSTGRRGRKSSAPAGAARVRAILAEKNKDADFWSLVGEIELDQLIAVADGSFLARAGKFVERFGKLHVAVKAARKWGSVYDTSTLVLGRYRSRLTSNRDRQTVDDVLALLRDFAHPK